MSWDGSERRKRGRPLPPERECPCGCGYRQPKLIWSEHDRALRSPSTYHGHAFKGGPPPPRVYRMGIRHEGRARRLGLPWEAIDLRLMYKHHKGVCGVCAQPVEFDVFTVDHIVAITNGGGHVWENLQVAHKDCNSRKGTKG